MQVIAGRLWGRRGDSSPGSQKSGYSSKASNSVDWFDWREFAGLLQLQVVVPPEFVLNCYNLNSA